MKKTLLFIFSVILFASASKAEQWRLHPTYDGNVARLIDTEDYTYFLSWSQPYFQNMGDFGVKYMNLYRYDKNGDELQFLNKQNILSENILQAIEYNRDKKYLVAVYDNGNIDLIYDNGKVKNVLGLKLAGTGYSKIVNSISFAPEYNELYLATEFGYIVIDDESTEVLRTINLGIPVNAIARHGDKLYVGASGSLYSSEFKKYLVLDDLKRAEGNYVNVKGLYSLGKRLYVWAEQGPSSVSFITEENGEVKTEPLVGGWIVSVEPRKEGIQVSSAEGMWCIGENEEINLYVRRSEDFAKNMIGWKGLDFWTDNGRDGISLQRLQTTPDGNKWVTVIEKLFPNACNAFKATYMTYSSKYGMLVRNHGVDARFETYDAQVPDLICSYKNMEWNPLSTTYLSPSLVFRQFNPNGVAIDPKNPDHVYSGSVFQGLLRLDLSDPSKSLRMSRNGAFPAGTPGYVGMHPDFTSWADMSAFSNPSFDNAGNLWTAWFDRDKLAAEKDNLELWYWTPEKRAASKDAASFQQFGKIPVKQLEGTPTFTLMALNSSASKNCLVYFSGKYETPLLVYNTNGTLENLTDDTQYATSSLSDKDGGVIAPSYLRCAYEDTSTGDVWMGYDGGVFKFKPLDFIKNGGTVQRIKVARNDGTNLADYLLSGVSVNCITADPSGKKWFSTTGGGIVVTSSDGSSIVKTYTTDNSPLPDNIVYGLCYNPENNSMMVSTEKGLAELFLSSASSETVKTNVKAYPNPVRPDYFGYVTIEGLSDNAFVKIVDAHGNLIKELGFASVGEITWDVTNLNMKRVPTGVYYVLASGGTDEETFSAVTKILVVN